MTTKLLMMIPSVKRLKEQLYRTRDAYRKEMERNRKRPARMIVTGLMSENAVAETLNGTETNPVMRAVIAIINAKIVELCDTATDRPRSAIQGADHTIPGYTMEERLHDAGGAAHLADLLAQLQELSKAKDLEPTTQAA